MANESMQKPDTMVSMTAAKNGKGPLEVSEISIKKADNGGFVVRSTKQRKGGGPGEVSDFQSTENVYPDIESVLGYARQEFGGADLAAAATVPDPAAQAAPAAMSGEEDITVESFEDSASPIPAFAQGSRRA